MPATLRVVDERVYAVARAIAGVGARVILALEEGDPQYLAALRVARAIGRGAAAVALALAAVSAYRLAMPGEEYWECFARHVEEWARRHGRPAGVEGLARLVASFLESCPGARVQREAKERRVARAARGARAQLEVLLSDPDGLPRYYRALAAALARALGQRPNAKTIVFAVKMAYYAVRPPGLREPVPIEVEIPVDVRVACATHASGMVEAPGYRALVQRPEPAQEAWRRASRISRVPTVHLDALAWRAGAAIRDSPEPRRAVEELLVNAGAGAREAAALAAELAWRRCTG